MPCFTGIRFTQKSGKGIQKTKPSSITKFGAFATREYLNILAFSIFLDAKFYNTKKPVGTKLPREYQADHPNQFTRHKRIDRGHLALKIGDCYIAT